MIDLTDRAAVNEAVAKATGWRFHERLTLDGFTYAAVWARIECDTATCGALAIHDSQHHKPPDYLSDDPALNREMLDHLRSTGMTLNMVFHGHARVIVWWRLKEVEGATEAEALVRALYAAGLLDKETRDE